MFVVLLLKRLAREREDWSLGPLRLDIALRSVPGSVSWVAGLCVESQQLQHVRQGRSDLLRCVVAFCC